MPRSHACMRTPPLAPFVSCLCLFFLPPLATLRCGRHYPAWTKKQEERKENLRLAHLTVQDEVAAHELSIQEAKTKQSEKAAAAALKAARAKARAKKAGAGGGKRARGGGGKRGGGSKRARLEKEARARKRAERKASLPAAPTRIKLEQRTSELEGECFKTTVTFCANPANDLTCPPSYIII